MKNGFSLVELMISMSIGLVISGGVIGVYISSQKNYQTLQVQIEMQENANFTFNYLNDAFKQIGYSGGCDVNVNIANTIVDGTSFSLDSSFQGYEVAGSDYNNSSTVTTLPSLLGSKTPVDDSDFIMLSLFDNDSKISVDNHITNSSVIHTTGAHSIEKGDFVAMVNADCSNMALFVQTGNGSGSGVVLSHNHSNGNAGSGSNNCISNNLGGHFDCTETSDSYEMTYDEGSRIYEIEQSILTILPSSFNADVGSLYRIKNTSEELVYGLKSMQFEYGMGVADGSGKQRITQYLTAREVTQWQDVVSIEVKLTMMATQSIDGEYPEKDFQSVFVLRNRIF
jgi:type IV pilus assembly protein PilW